MQAMGMAYVIDNRNTIASTTVYSWHSCTEEGQLQYQAERQALENGRILHQEVRDRLWEAALRYECPKCFVEPGSRCLNLVRLRRGIEQPTAWPHAERLPAPIAVEIHQEVEARLATPATSSGTIEYRTSGRTQPSEAEITEFVERQRGADYDALVVPYRLKEPRYFKAADHDRGVGKVHYAYQDDDGQWHALCTRGTRRNYDGELLTSTASVQCRLCLDVPFYDIPRYT